jgi:hypothetical protein
MKRLWDNDELVEQWTLQAEELAVIYEKRYPAYNKLGLALLLKYFQHEGQFPEHKRDIPQVVVEFIGKQLGIAAREFRKYSWQGRTIERHYARIRSLFGTRKATREDAKTLKEWLIATILPHQQQKEVLKAALIGQCRVMQIAPPTRGRLGRIARSALRSYEARFCAAVLARLSETTRTKLDALLIVPGLADSTEDDSKRSDWYKLKTDAGRASLESILAEFEKLELIEALGLPDDLFAEVPVRTLEGYRARIAVEDLVEIRRHPERVHYTLMAAFCWIRRQQIVDNLVDLLMDIVHGIGKRAEKKVNTTLLKEIKRVPGKDRVLYEISAASLEKPKGTVEEVVYAVAAKTTLAAIVEEYKASGTYDEQVNTVMRGSYSHHYRQMLPEILKHLKFQSNNQIYRPVIEALDLLKKYADSEAHYYDEDEHVPVECQDRGKNGSFANLVNGKLGDAKMNRHSKEGMVGGVSRNIITRRQAGHCGFYDRCHRFDNPVKTA